MDVRDLDDAQLRAAARQVGADPELAVRFAEAYRDELAKPSWWTRRKARTALDRYQRSIGTGWLVERDRLIAELATETDADQRKKLVFELDAVKQIICDLRLEPCHG